MDLPPVVLIYRPDERRADGAAAWRRLRSDASALTASAGVDAALALLVSAGEFEAAVYLDVCAGARADTHPLHLAVAAADLLDFPRSINRRPSEGFAYCALYPETYAAAGERR